MKPQASALELWPSLPWEEWKDTATTLHMWTHMVGKTRLALTPLLNHWWNVPLYVTARGLSTSSIPYQGHRFDLEFDFLDHRLNARLSSGDSRSIELRPQSVAAFYDEYTRLLRFAEDHRHASYDRDAVDRFWRILQHSDTLLTIFRALYRQVQSGAFFLGQL